MGKLQTVRKLINLFDLKQELTLALKPIFDYEKFLDYDPKRNLVALIQ